MSQLSRREPIIPDDTQQSESESGVAHPTLDPVLQNALETLDINLEEELARHRRHILLQQRAARQNPTQATAATESPFSFDGLDQGLDDDLPPVILPSDVNALTASVTESNPDLDAVQAIEADRMVQGTSSSDLVPIGPGTVDDTAVDDNDQQTDSVSFDLVTTNADEDLVPSLPPNPDDYLESSEELLRSLEHEEKRAEAIANESLESSSKQSLVDSIFTPLGVGSILLLILSSATLGYLVIRPSTLNMVASWLNPDGESSARIQIQPEGGLSNLSPDLAASEFDPLKASSLSSLSGVVDQNTVDTANQADSEAAGTPIDEGANNGAANSENASSPSLPLSNNGTNNPSATNTGGAGIVPPARVVGPSLSTSLPTAPPRVAPPRPGRTPPARTSVTRPDPNPPAPRATPLAPIRTTPVTATPAPSNPAPPPTPVLDPEPIPTPIEEQEGDPSIGTRPVSSSTSAQTPASPAPQAASTPSPALTPSSATTSAPSPAPSPAATVPATPAPPPASTAPVQDDLYYVTTPYTGDQSLESAREAVSGSYVRSFPEGTQVQMGAFSDPSGAESLRQNLQDQGIQAEIYKEEEE